MSSGIYAYWDNIKNYYVYIGKDSDIGNKTRHKDHFKTSHYNAQQINRVLQNNPKRYEYRVLMEGDYNNWQLNQMEKLCIKSFKTFKINYPERSVFNFTTGGDGNTLSGEERPNYRDDLNDNEIIDLYVNKCLSSIEIANKLNCDDSTIRRRLIKNNIKIRTRSEINLNVNNPSYRHDLDNNEIIDLYINQNFTLEKIADKLNCDKETVRKRLINNNIDLRRTGKSRYNIWNTKSVGYDKKTMFHNNGGNRPRKVFMLKYKGKRIYIGGFIDFTTPEIIHDLICEAIEDYNE